MRSDVPSQQPDGWIALNAGSYGDLRQELINSWRWFVQLIDEAERKSAAPKTSRFDMPVQQKRRGS
jgi:hypothetical protein